MSGTATTRKRKAAIDTGQRRDSDMPRQKRQRHWDQTDQQSQPSLSKKINKRQQRLLEPNVTLSSLSPANAHTNHGRWTPTERLLFLKGIRACGEHSWKEVNLFVETRTRQQIRSHAQKLMEQLSSGVNIFIELEQAERHGTAPPTPVLATKHLQRLSRPSPSTTTSSTNYNARATGTWEEAPSFSSIPPDANDCDSCGKEYALLRVDKSFLNIEMEDIEIEVAHILCSLATSIPAPRFLIPSWR
ncbi:hypothetical protein ACA910_021895 [Epithemia clementina (nom. ined.)]